MKVVGDAKINLHQKTLIIGRFYVAYSLMFKWVFRTTVLSYFCWGRNRFGIFITLFCALFFSIDAPAQSNYFFAQISQPDRSAPARNYALDDAAAQSAIDAYDRRDYVGAHRLAKPLAEAGNRRAQYVMGLLYRYGFGVPQNYSVSARWYRQAADQGNVFALNNLAYLYENGLGVDRNLAEARRLYGIASSAGNFAAQQNLDRIRNLAHPTEAISENSTQVPTSENIARRLEENSLYSYLQNFRSPRDFIEPALIAIGIILVISGLFYLNWQSYKKSKQCPNCKEEWSWNVVSSLDEPRSTFQKRERVGESRSGGDHAGYIYRVTTIEVGMRTEDFLCEKCGYQKTIRGSYQKGISSHDEVR